MARTQGSPDRALFSRGTEIPQQAANKLNDTAAGRGTGRICWDCAADSDVGRVRAQNEDAFWADGRTGVFVVADGMGGHAAGEVASAMAVREASQTLSSPEPATTIEEAGRRLRESIEGANRAILDHGLAKPEQAGMGTTTTALVLSPEAWFAIGHVGDSRAYLLRDGVVNRLTDDHTYVQTLVDDGRLTDEEARLHPRSSLLTRALGTGEPLSVDVYHGKTRPGDRFILTSDGLTTMLPEDELFRIMRSESSPRDVVERLIADANEAGGTDNITIIVVDVREGESEGCGRLHSSLDID